MNNEIGNKMFLVKQHSPYGGRFHSRDSEKNTTAFVYRDEDSARLSAFLLQIREQVRGYSSEDYYYSVELLNGRNVKSNFNTKGTTNKLVECLLPPERYQLTVLSEDHESQVSGRQRNMSLMRAWEMMSDSGMDFRFISKASLKSYAMANRTTRVNEGYFLFPEAGQRTCIGPFESPEAMLVSVERLMSKEEQHKLQWLEASL